MGLAMDMRANTPNGQPALSAEGSSGDGPPRSSMFRLSIPDLELKQECIESKLAKASAILKDNGVDMDTPLLTPDGFPRDDIDIVQVRIARSEIIHLRNDHKEVRAHIEQRVFEHYSRIRPFQFSSPSAYTTVAATVARAILLEDASLLAGPPFAKVDSLVPGSPADQADLLVGDLITNWAGVNWLNHENLTKIQKVVQKNEGYVMTVRVSRKDERHEGQMKDVLLNVVPRYWPGRGMLGCHLSPV